MEAFDAGGLEARSAALILSGQEGGALQVAALPLPLISADGEVSPGGPMPVLVLIEIDGESLLAVPGDEPPRDADEILTEVHAYAVGDDGALAGFFTQAFTFDPGLVSRPDWAGVRFLGRLEVPPGEYSLRLLVLRRATDRFALKAVPFSVPAPGAAGVRLLPPLFPTEVSAWLPVHMRGLEADEPLMAASPQPVVGPEESRSFFLAGLLQNGLSPGDLSLRILNGPDGEVIRQMEPASLEPAGDAQGWSIFQSGLAPTDLPPGVYRLEWTHAGGASAGLPLLVSPDPGKDPWAQGPRVWTSLLGAPETLASPEAIPSLDAERRLRKMRQAEMEAFRDAYLDSLRHLIAGDPTAARAAVVEIERSKIADGARERDVAQGQMLAAQMLVEEEAESLVPLIRLHLELYLDHLSRGDYLLATHSRRMMEVVLHLYVEASGSPEAGSLAANALVGLGQRLLDVGNLFQAQLVFDRALEHRSGDAAALLGQVCIDEMLGEHDLAVRRLRDLLAAHPKHPEGRLRLAINLERASTRRPEEARRIYQSLVEDEGGPEWIAVVAHEQLARAWTGDQRVPEAIRLLERGLERFPGEPRLYIQLAALHDRVGQLTEGRRVLAALERRMARGGVRRADSPRFRYTEWPEQAFAESQRELAEIVSARLPRLAEALEAEP